MKPALTSYSELQQAYDCFNQALFDGELPDCMLTLQRENMTYGYFSPDRFGNKHQEKLDEIALNPAYFAVIPLVEVMQTLVHEMVHLWQYHFGKPGRGRYHNEQWATKMEEVGLIPSETGQPGGKRTGDRMADYPADGGRFLAACAELFTKDFKISWYDRFVPALPPAPCYIPPQSQVHLPAMATSKPLEHGVETRTPTTPAAQVAPGRSNRYKYTCPCGCNVWGKPGLNLICGDCGGGFGVLG